MFAELNRKLANLLKQGVIAEVNPAGFVRVAHGGLLTDWLQYFTPSAGGVSVHRPPSVGENCLILSPSGDTANGLVVGGLASVQFPSPGQTADETVMAFPDGAVMQYNHATGALEVSGIQSANIIAAVEVNINAPQTTVNGKLDVKGLLTYSGGMSGSGGGGTVIQGKIEHQGDFENNGRVVSNGVELATHTHPDTTSGGNTGAPNG